MAALHEVALALSDPIRLQILDQLVAGRGQACSSPDNPDAPGGVCACDITPQLGLTPSKLSYHMKELRQANLVVEQKRGRWVYYTVNEAALAEFVNAIGKRFVESCVPSCLNNKRPDR